MAQKPTLRLVAWQDETKPSDGGNSTNDEMTYRETAEVVSGLVYLVFTLTLSLYYL